MLLKSLLKATFSDQVEVSPVKDDDIIKLYQKHHKQGSEKQRRILEIQRRAERKNARHDTTRRPRVTNTTFLPRIVTDVNRHNESTMRHDDKTQRVHLPRIQAEKLQLARGEPKGKSQLARGDRQPVFDSRFRGLLSSLIAIPPQFGQIQLYGPIKRISYATLQK